MEKRILSLLLVVMLLASLVPTAALADTTATSGKCCENLTWTLVDGTLTISGTGAMTDYDWRGSPWFNSRASITEIVISKSVTTIGNNAFEWCSSLTSVTIPGGVTEIGYCAFEGCSNLTSVKISDGVEIICGDAFHDCNSLEYVSIPSSVVTIGDAAFRLCSDLAEVDYAGSAEQWNAIDIGLCNDYLVKCYEGNRLVKGNIEWDIKDGTLFISGTGAMADYTYRSAPWYESKSNIKKVEISEGITSIGEYAFSECSNLIEIDIPDSVCAIGLAAFYGCTSLESVVLPEGIDNLNGCRDCYGKWEEGLFQGCTSLKNITIPSGVAEIGIDAFYGCSSLTDVYYSGTQEQWGSISIYFTNEPLLNATIHYNDESHTHSYMATVVDPTCTEQGYTLHKCSCGESYTKNYVSALGHTTETVGYIAPTCTEDGYTGDEICTVCGETVSTGEVIAATGHSYGDDNTCDNYGHKQSVTEAIQTWISDTIQSIRNFFDKIFGRI